MNRLIHFVYFVILSLFILTSCSDGADDFDASPESDGCASCDGVSDASADAGGGGQDGSPPGDGSGLITAGEWNDLENWDFWESLMTNKNYSQYKDYWTYYPNKRVSFKLLTSGGTPLYNRKIEVKNDQQTIWSAVTDNHGKAEIWLDLHDQQGNNSVSQLKVYVDGVLQDLTLREYSGGINEIVLSDDNSPATHIEVAFIVDATGSMADELEFLKSDLQDVVRKSKENLSNIDIMTATVFYRDEDDEYVTRLSEFTPNVELTAGFIELQKAEGGGDYPEAVHSALEKGIHHLQWTENSVSRIAFLLLDAPPHYEAQIIDQIQSTIKTAAKKGIKVIPITGSGIEKDTEFLMRFLAMATNGTYVFPTDDSGIGNDHIQASVGEYEVEYLNDLLVRLITKYSE
jgi:hypothetical protein